jgi:ribosomal protein L7/L12
MALVEVSCPRCHGPVDVPADASTVKCRFCGTLLRDLDAPKRVIHTRTVHVVVLERVGPSNRARAWDMLTKVGSLAPADAEQAVRNAPCDAGSFERLDLAEHLAAALRESGVTARVETRDIEVPAPVVVPDRSVHLDTVGTDKVAALKIIREHLDCGVYDAKALVDRAPCVIVPKMAGDRAAVFVDALNAAGATAKLGTPS